MEKTLNVALAGFGYAGRVIHAPLIEHTDGLKLHAVLSRQKEAVQATYPTVQVHQDIDALLRDDAIDLLVVATPNDSHAELACAALRAGKHVLVDKPLAIDLAQAEQIMHTAEEQGRIASVFQNRRWDADFLTLSKLVEDGKLGKVTEYHAHFDRFRPQVQERWRDGDGPGAGLWFDLGPHLMDQVLRLFGRPSAIQADLMLQRDGARSDDYFHVTLHYPQMRAHLHGAVLVPANAPHYRIHGTRASYLKCGLDIQEAQLRDGMAPGASGWGADTRHGELVGADDNGVEAGHTQIPTIPGDYRACYAAMRDAILGIGAPPVSANEALELMMLIELAQQSSRQRCTLDCPVR